MSKNLREAAKKPRPRIRVCKRYQNTYGDLAAKLYATLAIELDEWQYDLLCDIMATNHHGKFMHTISMFTAPRQNGKTEILKAAAIFLSAVMGCSVLFTAHEGDTIAQHFSDLALVVDHNSSMLKHPRVHKANGKEEIRFSSGGRITFRTRTNTGGLGRSYDVLILDEAQLLTEAQHATLLPTISSGKFGNPKMIFTGTPERPEKAGKFFAFKIAHALADARKKDNYAEFSALIDDIDTLDVHDEKLIIQANPAWGTRLHKAVIEEEQKMAKDNFARERLNWWGTNRVANLFMPDLWHELGKDGYDDTPNDKIAYGVKFANDGTTFALSVAIYNGETSYIELLEHKTLSAGTIALARWLIERWRRCSCIVIDGNHGAPILINDLVGGGVSPKALVKTTPAQVAEASQMFLADYQRKEMFHTTSEALDHSVLNASKRLIRNGGWGYMSTLDGADITPLESATLAFWGAKTTKRNPHRKQKIEFIY
jgi:hypothetical protein